MPSVEITTPFPSIEETAERAGVPASRARQIIDLARGISGTTGRGVEGVVKRSSAKRGRGSRKRSAKRATTKR
jgi:hypothetical protein